MLGFVVLYLVPCCSFGKGFSDVDIDLLVPIHSTKYASHLGHCLSGVVGAYVTTIDLVGARATPIRKASEFLIVAKYLIHVWKDNNYNRPDY